jgi:hypothetical protein
MRAFWGRLTLRTTLVLSSAGADVAGTSRLPVQLSSAWEMDARGCSLLDKKVPFLEKMDSLE